MKKTKRILLQLLITGSIIAMYVLPALASRGRGRLITTNVWLVGVRSIVLWGCAFFLQTVGKLV